MGKHCDRTINELNELMSFFTKEGVHVLPGSNTIRLGLATIASVLANIDINLAAIADALEEKRDDKASN
jgi:hypothetical protein